MKCQNPECENIVTDPTRKYCSQYCSGRYWYLAHKEERRTSSREWKSRTGYKSHEKREPKKGTDWLRSCVDENHRYTPPDFEEWKVKAGIVFSVKERMGAE